VERQPPEPNFIQDNSISPTPIANAELIGFEPVVGLSSVPKGRQKQTRRQLYKRKIPAVSSSSSVGN
jgi:hypothetical protein